MHMMRAAIAEWRAELLAAALLAGGLLGMAGGL
jgi:hypothetical protein